MKFNIILLLIMIFVPLGGCSSEETATAQPTQNLITTLASTESAPTYDDNNPFVIEQLCSKQESGNTPGNTSGVVVLKRASSDDPKLASQMYLWDLDTKTSHDLPVKTNLYDSNIDVSPNRTLLAIFEYFPQEDQSFFGNNPVGLSIFDSNGNLLTTMENIEINWEGLVGWLDDSLLQLSVFQFRQNNDPFDMPFLTMVGNPTDEFENAITLNYPELDLSRYESLPWWGEYGSTTAIYSLDLSHAVYSYSRSDWVLWDIQQNHQVAHVHLTYSVTSAPQWSFAGNEFLFEMNSKDAGPVQDEIYTMDKDGEITKLTDFSNQDFEFMLIMQPTWSPDDNKIAFWYSNSSNSKRIYNLGYFNLETNVATFFSCVSDTLGEESTIPHPYWSLDGEQLLVRSSSRVKGITTYKTLIVTIKDGSVVEVEKDVVPHGWMAPYQPE